MSWSSEWLSSTSSWLPDVGAAASYRLQQQQQRQRPTAASSNDDDDDDDGLHPTSFDVSIID